jgi:SAM-dependent methyltransferase
MREFADKIVDHYERHARAWDADRGPAGWNDKPWHDRFAAALPTGATILDLGCGSGVPVARYFGDLGFQVTGIDSSPTMIAMCRERLPGHEFLVADMRFLRLGRHFAGILAWDSFFHLEPDEQRRMFDVFARHSAVSTVLMFNSGSSFGEVVGSYRGDPLYHASLSAGEYGELLSANGFEVILHSVEDWQTGCGRTVWLASRLTGMLRRPD